MNVARRLAWGWLAATSLAQAATPEQELDFAARDAERVLNRLVLPGDQHGANDKLQAILNRLIAAAPDSALADCRVQLMKGGRPSAFALPNCRLYVSTALFMRLENDAQLATLLARELGHVQLHSAVKQRVAIAKAENSLKVLAVLTAAAGGIAAGGSGDNANPTVSNATNDLIWRVSVSGYSRELEVAADRAGIWRFQTAGFAAADAMRALELLIESAPKNPGCSVPLLSCTQFLSTRIASLGELTRATSATAATADPEYTALAARLRVEQVRVHIDAREYVDASRVLAEQVAAQGENGITLFLAGELARLQGGSRTAALIAYEQGATFADAPAKLFLSQGLMLRENQEHERARQALQRYLELAPDAVEAPLVRDYLDQHPPTPGK